MWSSILFGLTLIAISIGMLWRQLAAGPMWSEIEMDESERTQLARQQRRRKIASGVMGGLGLAVLGGYWIRDPVWSLYYWAGVGILVIWMAGLAMADLASTRSFYYRLCQQQARQRDALQAEIAQLVRDRKTQPSPNQECSPDESEL